MTGCCCEREACREGGRDGGVWTNIFHRRSLDQYIQSVFHPLRLPGVAVVVEMSSFCCTTLVLISPPSAAQVTYRKGGGRWGDRREREERVEEGRGEEGRRRGGGGEGDKWRVVRVSFACAYRCRVNRSPTAEIATLFLQRQSSAIKQYHMTFIVSREISHDTQMVM